MSSRRVPKWGTPEYDLERGAPILKLSVYYMNSHDGRHYIFPAEPGAENTNNIDIPLSTVVKVENQGPRMPHSHGREQFALNVIEEGPQIGIPMHEPERVAPILMDSNCP